MNFLPGVPSKALRSPSAALEVRAMNPLDGPEWDRLVASHPEATLFHSAAWARVLIRTYHHRPCYFACWQQGRLAALVPVMEVRSIITGRRGVCLPFSDFCDPLIFDGADSDAVFAALTSLAARRGWKHWEVRGGQKPEPASVLSESFYSHSLDLSGEPDDLFSGFDPSVRRAVRKAERSGLAISVRSDEAAMSGYYQLHVRTRRRHGLPPQPFAFFRHIHEEIIQTGLGWIVLASRGANPVAGAIFFHLGQRAIYKFGACDERLQDLRANNLVMWAGIRFLCTGGYTTLDFGRTSRTQEGLRHYKLGWGTHESPIHYYRWGSRSTPGEKTIDRSAGRHTALFSRLPLSFNRLLGTLIYPHLD